MKSIVEFLKTMQNDNETIVIVVQVTDCRNVTSEYDYLRKIGFRFDQVEADYIRAEYHTTDYDKAISIVDDLRLNGYTFEE